MIFTPDLDCLPPVEEPGVEPAQGHALPCAHCAAVQRDPATALPVVDMARALEDFDNNVGAVLGLLRDFLGEQAGCLRQIAALRLAPRGQARAVVHDLANTLDAGWCRLPAMALRAQEDLLRGDAPRPPSAIAAEVEATVRQAFDGVRRQLAYCLPCPLGAPG